MPDGDTIMLVFAPEFLFDCTGEAPVCPSVAATGFGVFTLLSLVQFISILLLLPPSWQSSTSAWEATLLFSSDVVQSPS